MPALIKQIKQSWRIPHDLSGIRADHYLVHYVGSGRISRTKAQKIISNGDFKLPHTHIKPSKKLKQGESVELWRIPPDSPSDSPEKFNKPIKIIFEDQNLFILDKPSNLAMHPSARYFYQTLTYWLKINYPNQNIHPCHRIDRETSGLIICAKNFQTQSLIKKKFMDGQIQKSYLAICEGRLSKATTNTKPLALQKNRGLVGIKMIEDLNFGLSCETHFTPLIYNPILNWSLIKCEPKTGRQHQIRAHLELDKHPIIGDKLYHMGEEYFDAYTKKQADLTLLSLPRQALHAHEIKFNLNGKHYEFTAPNLFFDAFSKHSPSGNFDPDAYLEHL